MIYVVCTDISSLEEGDYITLYQKATQERKERADRYRRKEDSLRCVMAEALLRYALKGAAFTVIRGAGGKPWIPEHPEFHFNLSHGGRWVVLAYGNSEVGVDVEQIRQGSDIHGLTGRFLSRQEREYVLEDSVDIHRRFLEIWTAKESYIKYMGTGLRIDLTSFNVLELRPGLKLHQHWLDENSCITLCAGEDECSLVLLDPRSML